MGPQNRDYCAPTASASLCMDAHLGEHKVVQIRLSCLPNLESLLSNSGSGTGREDMLGIVDNLTKSKDHPSILFSAVMKPGRLQDWVGP